MITQIRLVVLVAGFASAGVPAFAHAFLKNATPAVGSTVQAAPSQVVIEYTEGVEPLFSTIEVQDAQGTEVTTGKPHVLGDDTHLAVAVKALAPGRYSVTWHATATDTHKTEGKFSFTVAR